MQAELGSKRSGMGCARRGSSGFADYSEIGVCRRRLHAGVAFPKSEDACVSEVFADR